MGQGCQQLAEAYSPGPSKYVRKIKKLVIISLCIHVVLCFCCFLYNKETTGLFYLLKWKIHLKTEYHIIIGEVQVPCSSNHSMGVTGLPMLFASTEINGGLRVVWPPGIKGHSPPTSVLIYICWGLTNCI